MIPQNRRTDTGKLPWGNEEQKRSATEAKQFKEKVMPRDEEAKWRRNFCGSFWP